MSDVTIRQVDGEELVEASRWQQSYAFQPTPPVPARDKWEERVGRRRGATFFAAFEEEKARAILGSATLVQNVRHSLFPMGGVFGVASHPAARRRGHVRELMRQTLESYRQEGRPFSCLYPFRDSFYERMGYVSFPHPREVVFDPAPLTPLLKMELAGSHELMLVSEGYGEYRAFLRQLQQTLHGMAIFEEEQEESVADDRDWLLLAIAGGEVAGLMLYRMEGDFIPFTMQVSRFYYLNSHGRYLLLSWLARHVDQVSEVALNLPAYEMVKTWWPDLKPAIKLPFLAPQGRIVDVAAIGGMASGPGRFSVEVEDTFCPWNEGIWAFESVAGRLEVGRGGEPEGKVTIHGLSALVYGTNDPETFPYRGWGQPSAALQEKMRALFPQALPHLHETY